MKDYILSYLKYGHLYYGIEHTNLGSDLILYGLGIKKSKRQLEIKQELQVNSLEDLAKQLSKNTPVFLIINNDLVLTKRIEENEGDDIKLLQTAFPNLKRDDFYYEILKQDDYCFVSICRKADVDSILKKYTVLGVLVIDFSLGKLIAYNAISFIEDLETITLSNAKVSLDRKEIYDIKKKNDLKVNTYDVNGISVANKHLLSFSGILTLILKNNKLINNLNSSTVHLLNEFVQKRFFSQFLKLGLASLFTILLVNFLVFNHYFEKTNNLRETSQVIAISKEKVNHLNEKVIKAKNMVEDVQKSSSSRSSFYIYQLMSNLPETIILSDLEYQPLLKKINKDKPIQNIINSLRISGSSRNSDMFSDWIASLEKVGWIDQVEVIDYEGLAKGNSNFDIKISIVNEG